MPALAAELLNQTRTDESVEGYEIQELYQVRTTDASVDAFDVLAAPGLPALNSPFGSSFLTRVSNRRPFRPDHRAPTYWHVEVAYRKDRSSQEDRQNPPTLRPVVRSAGIRWVERALMMDKDDNAIITSAKTPFNPPLTASFPHPVVTFVRWEETFSTATQLQYGGKVNSETFGVYEPGYVLCSNIGASEQWELDASGVLKRYWQVTYEFEASPELKWRPAQILDADYWFIDPDDSKRKPIYVLPDGTYTGDPTEEGAAPAPTPIPLKGEAPNLGNVLVPADIPEFLHFLEFNLHDQVDFNALNLPVD